MSLKLALVLVVLATSSLGQVFTYEAADVPENSQWILLQRYCSPETWIEGGRYIQHTALDCGPPPHGHDSESFTRPLTEYQGQYRFFIEWTVETSGDRSEILWGAPVILSAWSQGAVNYQFSIARDQVRLIRDNRLPILYVDVVPGVLHTYRLELYGADLYVWYIDGEVIDSGIPEAAYPSSNPNMNWRGKSAYYESTTKWDYIRYGVTPADGSADFDSDDALDLFDHYYVQECFDRSGPAADAGPGCRFADFDGDADVDLRDFAEFQNRFTGPR